MTARVVAGLRVVQAVAERFDPTSPLMMREIAELAGLARSSASRLCAELEHDGLLKRAETYGSYCLGPAAIQLSGSAAEPFAQAVRYALTLAAEDTGETVCLAARSRGTMRIIAAVSSAWTLYSRATVGEIVDDHSAIRQADQAGYGVGSACFQSTIGDRDEIATPIVTPTGECVAVLAVRLPRNRSRQGSPRARSTLEISRRSIERSLERWIDISREVPAPLPEASAAPTALQASLRALRYLAVRPDTVMGISRATGLRPDRTRRLVESCRNAGVVEPVGDERLLQLSWSVHGWHRAAAEPTMVTRGSPFVAETAATTGVSAFITVLRGIRSFTLVEVLNVSSSGIEMTSWLGRPCPVVAADGGAALVMDFGSDEIPALLPRRHSNEEVEEFLDRVQRVTRDGVVARHSIDEVGLTSISAPVRDSSGTVAAAICLVGPAETVDRRISRLKSAARQLADGVARLLCAPAPTRPHRAQTTAAGE